MLQLRSQRALRTNCLEDVLPPRLPGLDDLRVVAQPLQRAVVEPGSRLLPVAGDERNGRSAFEELKGARDGRFRERQLARDERGDRGGRHAPIHTAKGGGPGPAPIGNGSPSWDRTSDLRINSPPLCQLSYRGTGAGERGGV